MSVYLLHLAVPEATRCILRYSTFPYKGVLVSVGLNLRSIDKDVFSGYFAKFIEKLRTPRMQLLCAWSKMQTSKSGNGCMVWYWFALQKIHEVNIPVASTLDFSGRKFSGMIKSKFTGI